ncbi:Hypothetical Protein FCC1311_053182, partial [Hondaea fermentalgiana]
MANNLDEDTREAIANIKSLLQRIQEHNSAVLEFLDPDDDASTKILSHVVALVDFVRRVRARMMLSVHEYQEWEKLTGTASELERCNVIVNRATAILFAMRGVKGTGWRRVANFTKKVAPLLSELRNGPLAESKSTPFLALPSFDIMSTRRLNLKIDFRWNIYEFICPDDFDDVYLTASNLDWFKHQRYEDTTRRFLHYGGFLYFDANRHFVSASALTVGTTLSFNGPFKLNEKTVDKLEAEKRWHKVTIQSLQPEDAKKLEFCF